MKDLGLLIKITDWDSIDVMLDRVENLGFRNCQISTYVPELLTQATADKILGLCKQKGIEITMMWVGWPGKCEWNFVGGPDTVGIVPLKYRAERVAIIKRGSDFAKLLGVELVASHAGFIPENMSDPLYPGVVEALRDLALHCKGNGQVLCFETGQETPVTLLRTLEDVGTGNLGVNLDPANLVMYGKGNPVDALKVIGKFVRGIHIKDGKYPTDGRELGIEVPLGQGDVDFPKFFAGLEAVGYRGAYTLEIELDRRLKEESPREALEAAKAYLRSVLG